MMLKENRIFWAVMGAVIVGGAIYFSSQEKGKPGSPLPLVQCPAPSKVMVTKIIDGDTIIVEGGYHIRLLGIDADERDYPCYEPAKNRLEELILNKEVKLEKDITDVDQYKRCLRYIFLDKQSIDLELVKEGLAIARFYEPDVKYKDEITSAEKTAIENKIGCKWNGKNISGSEEKTNFLWEKLTPELTKLKVIDACQSGNYSGKEIIVEGKISGAYRSKTNTIFLNFEKPYPNQCFTSVIFSSNQYKFVQSPEKYYSQKTVRIRGEIKEYQRKPEIILKDPLQIEIGK